MGILQSRKSAEPLRDLYSCLREDTPDPVTSARVRRRVFDRLENGAKARPSREFVRWLAFGAVAAALAFGVSLSLLQWREPAEPSLRIHANGGVRLEWNDVGQHHYQVFRSDRPDFSVSRRETVRGTAYVDPETTESAVVYYRVE